MSDSERDSDPDESEENQDGSHRYQAGEHRQADAGRPSSSESQSTNDEVDTSQALAAPVSGASSGIESAGFAAAVENVGQQPSASPVSAPVASNNQSIDPSNLLLALQPHLSGVSLTLQPPAPSPPVALTPQDILGQMASTLLTSITSTPQVASVPSNPVITNTLVQALALQALQQQQQQQQPLAQALAQQQLAQALAQLSHHQQQQQQQQQQSSPRVATTVAVATAARQH